MSSRQAALEPTCHAELADSFCDRRERDRKGRQRSTQPHSAAPGQDCACRRSGSADATCAPPMGFHDRRIAHLREGGRVLGNIAPGKHGPGWRNRRPSVPSRSIQNLRASMPGYAVNVGEEATKTRVDHRRGARSATQRLSRIGRLWRVFSTGLFLHAWSLARQSVCLCCDRRRSIRVSVAIPDRFCRMPAMHRIERPCRGGAFYSSAKDSDSIPMFFSPAAFFSRYFFTQAAKLLPAAVSLPVKPRAAISL